MGSASDLDILPRIIVALLLHCSLVSRGLFCMSGLQMDRALQPDFSPYEEEEFVNSVDLVLVAKSTRRGCQL